VNATGSVHAGMGWARLANFNCVCSRADAAYAAVGALAARLDPCAGMMRRKKQTDIAGWCCANLGRHGDGEVWVCMRQMIKRLVESSIRGMSTTTVWHNISNWDRVRWQGRCHCVTCEWWQRRGRGRCIVISPDRHLQTEGSSEMHRHQP
jgi:hypothetical protein